MVISGKGSTLDFYTALEIIKNKMGTTHDEHKSVVNQSPDGIKSPERRIDSEGSSDGIGVE